LACFSISDRQGGMRRITRIRAAVRGNAFTSGSAFGQFSADLRGTPIITQFAPIAEAVGRAPGTALDQVFVQFGIR